MINHSHRFHGYNALRYVYRQGRTTHTSSQTVCSLRYVSNPRRTKYRLAVVVSKKQSKSAVVRNRIRRRLYEAGRELIPVDARYDLVVTVMTDKVATIPKKDMNRIFNELLQVSGIKT